jgi:lipid-A-disaccharide synthase
VKLIPADYRYSALFYGECGVVASGTASLEAALTGLPHVVVYKLNPLTYRLARKLVKVPFVSLPNLIAGEEIVPELLQEAVDPDTLTDTFLTLQENRGQVKRLLSTRVSSKLKGGAIETLARKIREELAGV